MRGWGCALFVVLASTSCARRDPAAGAGREVVGAHMHDFDPPGMRVLVELCANGIDDDGNTLVDDGCPCVVGQRQRCYVGDAARAGVGVCAFGVATCVTGAAGIGEWSACDGSGAPAGETCNGLDDDCDGRPDDGCTCDEGTTQACFVGAAAARDVGTCASGTQTCISMPGLDGLPGFGFGPCVGAIGPRVETCNAQDDDCNGTADDLTELCNFRDDDCDGLVDEEGVCPPASTLGYALTRSWIGSGSGVLPPSAPLYDVVVAPGPMCAPGETRVLDETGHVTCAPPIPTDCPDGTQPSFDAGMWRCVPCPIVMQFGNVFAYERTCAPEAPTCDFGLTPTFVAESRTWECRPPCDDGLYDQHYLDGTLICVPC